MIFEIHVEFSDDEAKKIPQDIRDRFVVAFSNSLNPAIADFRSVVDSLMILDKDGFDLIRENTKGVDYS